MRRSDEFLACARSLTSLEGRGPNIKGALLGKTPQYSPDRAFDTVHVYLELELNFVRQSLAGLCRTTVRPFRAGLKTLEFDAVGLDVGSAAIDGENVRFSAKNGKLVLTARRAFEPGREYEVSVRYRTDHPKSGLHFVSDPVQAWSQSQPEDARYWYPCHDNPQQKATSEVRGTVPKGFRLISNGALIETVERAGKTTFHWRMDRPHAIYLVSIAAGRFSEIEERWEDVPVTYYCEKGREADARRGFAKTVKAIDFFSRMTGVPYPYDKYAQVAVAEYPGGMEHTTCTTQTDACLIDKRAALDCDLDLLVAHELAHQWFGDLVTCREWAHAWLNEGFATYFEVLFQWDDKGRDEAEYELFHNAGAYFEEDSRRYRRPIVCATYKHPWTIFDRHTYEKGAWVLHMLKAELGDELWWKCISYYLKKHRDGSVETLDLIEAIAEVSGRNLKPFFDQWVFRAGYPSLRVHYSWEGRSKKAALWIAQTQDVSDDSPAFRLKLPIRFVGRGWTRDFTADLSEKEHRLAYALPTEPLNVELDPEYTILKKVSLRKPHAMWLHQLKKGATARSRHAAARGAAAWPSNDTVEAIEKAARREPFWGAACEMVHALGGIRSDASYRALTRLLGVKHSKVRRAVVESLAQHKRPETARLVAPLARRDESILVEAEALRALGASGDGKYLPLVRAGLKKVSYRDVIAAGAVGGLAATKDKSVLMELRRQSLPPHGFYRRAQAIRGLTDYCAVDDRVVAWISELVPSHDERISLVAISALGQLEDERALPALEKARQSPNMRVRVYAEEALARVRAGLDPKKA